MFTFLPIFIKYWCIFLQPNGSYLIEKLKRGPSQPWAGTVRWPALATQHAHSMWTRICHWTHCQLHRRNNWNFADDFFIRVEIGIDSATQTSGCNGDGVPSMSLQPSNSPWISCESHSMIEAISLIPLIYRPCGLLGIVNESPWNGSNWFSRN